MQAGLGPALQFHLTSLGSEFECAVILRMRHRRILALIFSFFRLDDYQWLRIPRWIPPIHHTTSGFLLSSRLYLSHPFLFLKLSISTFSSWGTHHLNTTCLPLKIYCTDVGASFLRTTGKRGAQKEEYSHSFHWEVVWSKQRVDSKGSERPLYLCRARKTYMENGAESCLRKNLFTTPILSMSVRSFCNLDYDSVADLLKHVIIVRHVMLWQARWTQDTNHINLN